MARWLTMIAALFCLLAMATGSNPAFAGTRVALVIGNAAYKDPHLTLSNPKNDADDVSAALKALGFNVITSTDLNLPGFEDALGQFKASAKGAEIALFFYAGHAVQYEHVNYFIPTDAVIDRVDRLKHAAIGMDEIQDALSGAEGVQVMILDSCRDNPFASLTLASRSIALTRGIERVQVGSGDSVILYSTRANDVALDGAGQRNSPFSSVLVQTLQQPGRHELGGLLRQVAAKVKGNTGGKQSPELTMSISGDYFLDLANDRQEWDAIKDSLDPKVFSAFIDRFPDSALRRDAERRVQVFTEQALQRRREEDVARRQEEARRLAEKEERHRQEAERERQDAERQRVADEARLKAVCSIGSQYLDVLVTGRDRAGLERLARDNACPSLAPTIAQAIASVTAINRQATCDRAADDLARDVQSGNRAGLKDIQASADCPGLPDRASAALAELDAADQRQKQAAEAQRVCDADEARLGTLRDARRTDDIAALGAASTCEKVRGEAIALASDLRQQEAAAAHVAQQAAACTAEDKRLQAFVMQGPREAIEALGRAHQCETLKIDGALAQFDDLLARRRDQALAACAAVDVSPLQAGGDVKGLGELAQRCPSRKADTDAAVASIAARRHLAEVCQRETQDLNGAVAARRPAAVADLQKRAECPSLDFTAANRQIAKADCDLGVAAVGRIGAGDETGLRGFADKADACPEVRKTAADRLAALVAGRTRDDGDCDAAIADAVRRNDVAALQRLPKAATCPRRQNEIAAAVDGLRAAEKARLAKAQCDAGVKAVAALGASDETALRGVLGDAATCEDARVAARGRLATLVAARADEDRQCDAAIGEAAGREDVAALGTLTGTAGCLRRRDVIADRIGNLRLDERNRTTAAQRQLATLGCYSGQPNGTFDATTKAALTAYRQARHVDGAAPTRISAEVLADLFAQDGPVCALASLEPAIVPTGPVAPPPVVQTPVAPPATTAAPAKASPPKNPTVMHRPKVAPVEREPVQAARPRPRVKELAEPALRVRPVRPPRVFAAPAPRAPRPAPAVTAEPAEPSAAKPHIFY